MSNKAAEVVALYQRYFDEEISRKDEPKALCCSLIQEIAQGAAAGLSKKQKFQEKANAFPHFGNAHRSEFARWSDDAFERLFDAFRAIFGIENPLDGCEPPAAVRDARFRWVWRPGRPDIQFRVLEFGGDEPPLVVVTVFDPQR